jgi:hypothetical protein
MIRRPPRFGFIEDLARPRLRPGGVNSLPLQENCARINPIFLASRLGQQLFWALWEFAW